ncbi:MAG TPA: glutamate--tRNA ligase [Nitrososphaeraceae archaeon]
MDIDMDTQKLVEVTILRNAIDYNGRAKFDTVISKILGSKPEIKDNLKDVMPKIKEILEQINSLPIEKQRELLLQKCPTYLETKKAVEKNEIHLPPLLNAKHGKVVTRFPPEPNGYPHIGHAKAAVIDEEYAKMYSGKLILRFDDTNPLNEKLEYYDAIMEGLSWLNIVPDIIKNTSDDIHLLHFYGKKLINKGNAYICLCDQNTIHHLRSKGLPCQCRIDSGKVLENSDKIFNGYYHQNEAIIRFKGNMNSDNTAMRDPTLFRIIEHTHPLLGDKIILWPTYDFAAPIEDSLDGVTHAFRTKEYELRNELYQQILKNLEMRIPEVIEFSRLEFEGLPVSKRKLKPLIEEKKVEGWSDPRLPTLMGMKRRGFTPEAIRRFVLSLGITLSETKPSIEVLEAFNRKIIDSKSKRLLFVNDPVKITIKNVKQKEVVLKNHPSIEMGSRKIYVNNVVFISSQDAEKLKNGMEIRLIELYNIKVSHIDTEKKEGIVEYRDNVLKENIPKIQWVSKEDLVKYTILKPNKLFIGDRFNPNSLEIIEGFAESFVTTLANNTMVQFIRLGFCRIEDNKSAIFTHK